jgi:hypothetical protein
MKMDLWGEVTVEASDYADEIINQLNNKQNVAFEPNYDSTGKGVTLIPNTIKLPDNGIHCIYRNNVPLYVGYSGNSTRERLGKFCGAVRKTLRSDERHIGGERYLKAFGEDFEGITVRAVEYYAGQDISVKLSTITYEMAIKLNASFNDVIYKKLHPDAESDTEEFDTLWDK